MTISLSDTGKRFNRDWIFRHFNYTFDAGQWYAITGPNGSGKSTLLQVLSAAMMPSEGTVEYKAVSNKPLAISREPGARSQEPIIIPVENIYRHVSICAPYLELVEEMTLKEFLYFHNGFKPFIPGVTTDTIIAAVGLDKALNKQIRNFSSGMKQRAKLAQCIFSDTPIVLLDEPCTNLDAAGIELYQRLIAGYCKNRLVIVSSNDEVEYAFCREKINMADYKN